MPVLRIFTNGAWQDVGGITGGVDADTLDGKHASDFAEVSSVTELQALVGDTAVSTQISESVDPVVSDINTIKSQLADLMYEAISITSFTNNVGTVEIGSTVASVQLTWATNKTPTTLKLNDAAMSDMSLKTYTYSGLNLTSNTTYTLVATDERNASASKSTSVNFLNGIYYGAIDANATLNSATVLTMTKKLQNSRGVTFTVTPGATEHIAYALPSRLGTPTFTVGVLQGGFFKKGTIDFTNSSGYTESYDIYFSTNANLGQQKVVVS